MNLPQALDRCYYCPRLCKQSCPVADAEQNEMSTPQAKMATMKLLEAGHLEWNRVNALQAYKCSHCGQSQEACELDNPVADVLDQFRAKAFQKGLAPQAVYQYCKKFKRHNNPYGVPLLPRLKKGLNASRFQKGPLTYFPGCVQSYEQIDIIRHTLELSSKLGGPPLRLFDQAIQCCAYPLLSAGDLNDFKEHAEVLTHLLEAHQTLVVGEPTCAFTLKKIYPAYGYPLKTKIVTLPAFIDEQMRAQNFHVRKGVATQVAYHDPCYLGRRLHIYEEPRRSLETVTGTAPLEFSRHHEKSYCSGGGGLLPVACPELAQTMTKTRMAEFNETGAKVLVSSCSTCVKRFRGEADNGHVKNLVEFLNSAIVTDTTRSLRGKTS